MHIILGGTGHVGSAVAKNLLEKGEPVTVVTRDASKAAYLETLGAEIAEVDVLQTDQLREVFHRGKCLFFLNPPADPSSDTDVEERKTLKSILSAIRGSGLEKIVAESTYGAQPAEKSGDLGVLYEMEKALEAQPVPSSIIRAAYYMSNWDASLATAAEKGVIHSFFPSDFKLPMVAPDDIGEVAAKLMTQPDDKRGTYYVEGPELYSASDVAAAFQTALQKPVKVEAVPRENLIDAFKEIGFSDEAAASYAGMTEITLDRLDVAKDPIRGRTSLQTYVTNLIKENDG